MCDNKTVVKSEKKVDLRRLLEESLETQSLMSLHFNPSLLPFPGPGTEPTPLLYLALQLCTLSFLPALEYRQNKAIYNNLKVRCPVISWYF